MIKLEQLAIGMKVRVKSGFGSGPIHTGKITEIETDIKNGCPGIGYDIVGLDGKTTDDSRWAYLDQLLPL